MADQEKLRAHLTEAEDALHRLNMGMLEVEVSYEGHTTKYSPASEARLRRYIRELKTKLGETSGAGMSRRVTF
ncbi:MAG: gpW family head-tail joining protein [Pseudomonadota bacterium]